ncbi:MAG: ISAs1 family transposase [Candidatus Brocadia sp.]|nr:ISAs1 family transposase [Candidatus Brocadia sp.]
MATISFRERPLCGAHQQDGHKVHLLSAFLQQKDVVIAQCAVDRKTNEIQALRTLPDPLDIKDRAVTLDALHTQKDTARYIVEEKMADYLFVVKKSIYPQTEQ